MSLVASDTYIIPAFMDYLALDGMGQTLNSVKALKDFPSITQPTLLGVLPTNFSEARRGDHEMYQTVATTLGAKLILPCIRTDARAAYAASHQMTIWEFAPNGKGVIGSEKPIGLEGTNSLGLHRFCGAPRWASIGAWIINCIARLTVSTTLTTIWCGYRATAKRGWSGQSQRD